MVAREQKPRRPWPPRHGARLDDGPTYLLLTHSLHLGPTHSPTHSLHLGVVPYLPTTHSLTHSLTSPWSRPVSARPSRWIRSCSCAWRWRWAWLGFGLGLGLKPGWWRAATSTSARRCAASSRAPRPPELSSAPTRRGLSSLAQGGGRATDEQVWASGAVGGVVAWVWSRQATLTMLPGPLGSSESSMVVWRPRVISQECEVLLYCGLACRGRGWG